MTPLPLRRAFTLMELLVVIALIALVSGMAVGMYQGIGGDSSEKVSIANQQGLVRAVGTFLTLNREKGLDRLDALIDRGTSAGTAGTWANLSSTTAVGGIYRGVKTADAGGSAVDAVTRAKNLGLADGLAGQATVYYLTAGDSAALAALGLGTVWYHNPCALGANVLQAAHPDGTAVSDEPGLLAECSAAYKSGLAGGVAVLAIDPLRGAGLYRAFGEDLQLPASPAPSDASAQAAARGAGTLLLFGLGEQASLVGARTGGLTSVPRCEVLGTDHYRNYLLVVRLPAAGEPQRATVVGVLDPQGLSVRAARLANDRRHGGT